MPRKKSKTKAEPKVGGILGLGLDADDGHRRVTETDEMVLVGGSEGTHERMQETAIRFSEELDRRGKALPETTIREAMDLLREAMEKTGR